MAAGILEIRILGPLEVAIAGRTVVIGSPKQRLLLAMLAVHRRCSVDALAEELWDGRPPASLAPTLQSLVSRLRRLLVDDSGPGSEPAASLQVQGDGYSLELGLGVLDASRFEGLVAQGRRSMASDDPTSAVGLFRESLGLWRGPALAGLSDREFARSEAARLEGLRSDTTEELAEAELAAGRPAAALAVLEKHLADEPLRERAWGQRMVALYRLGRQADALRSFQTLRALLAEELGLEPTPALARLETQILRHDPALQDPRMASSPSVPAAGGTADAMAAFLFTDIVASTQRWDDDRDAMAADLARHDAIVGQAIRDHGGAPFSHTGDGVAAAFSSVPAAVAAAVAAQRAVLVEPWSGSEPLRVRMAVHVGTAQNRAGTFLGPAVHRAARLLNHAAGGQIVCSTAAAELARDGLPKGVSLADLGEHPLAGFTQPERIHRVIDPEVADSLPFEFRAAHTGHNLPTSATSFVGRERELSELDGLIRTSRLLTVTGAGGAGKTRLAVEAARRMARRFPDGVWLVDLVPLRDPDLVAEAVTAAFGLLTGDRPAVDVVCGYLADREALVVLDNCEHVLSGVRALVGPVLARAPRVTIVATSREVLAVPGESLWLAPALSLPPAAAETAAALADSDAVALFAERAATSLPGFSVSDANASAVSRICRRLDGLPLALELAAGRMRVLGAGQLADRLDDRFKALGALPAGADPRRRTLRATMEWSWALLAPPERTALARLAVFPATFDLEAAEAAIGSDVPDVLDVVARLVDTSLLVVEPGARAGDTIRYRLLETVRQFAAEQLEAEGATAAIERRHLDHFVGRCEAWRLAGRQWYEAEWSLLSYRDREDYSVALDRALAADDRVSAAHIVAAQWAPWTNMGRTAAHRERIERTLTPVPAVPATIALEAIIGLAFARWEAGQGGLDGMRSALLDVLGEAEAEAAAGLRDGTPHRGVFEQFHALYFLGEITLSGGEPDRAAAYFHRARATAARHLAGAVGERTARLAVGWCDHGLGWTALVVGDLTEADRLFASALFHEETGRADSLLRAHFLAGAAVAAAALGDQTRAVRSAAEAVTIARHLPFRGIEAMALCRAAEAAALCGDLSGPAACELLRVVRELGGVRWVARALALASLAADARGRPEDAAAALASAQRLGESMASTPAVTRLLDRCVERVVACLGPERLAAVEAAARNRSLDRALLDAITALTGSVSDPPQTATDEDSAVARPRHHHQSPVDNRSRSTPEASL